ncbi:MAG: serine hydrolase domain-containing protein [Gammaproteobacteria bacterium]
MITNEEFIKKLQELGLNRELFDNANIPALSLSWCLNSISEWVASGRTDTSTPNPVDTNTLFQAASLSKPVSSAIVLDLIAQEKWDLHVNTPLVDIVPDYGPELQQDTENYKKLTIGMVLGQRSGLPNWFGPGVEKKFIATPDSEFKYSGVAFYFLKQVIEEKTNRKWEEIAQDFFTKTGMTSSTFKPLPASHLKNTHKVASAHLATGLPVDPFPDDTPEIPAGSLLTTAKDYITFLQYCFKNLKSQLLTCKPLNLPNMPAIAEQIQWGLGMGIYTDPETKKTIAFHWGNNTGTSTFCAMDMATGDCVACFSNSVNGPQVFEQVVKPIVGDIKPLFQWLATFCNFKDASAPQAPDSTESEPKKKKEFSPAPLPTTLKQSCNMYQTPKLL